MAINSQRWFMRKEEYEMPKPHPDCLLKYFTIRCRKCGSFKLTLTAHYDEQTGESLILFFCSSCRQQEEFKVKVGLA
jgi:transcription elongation factor Elf1